MPRGVNQYGYFAILSPLQVSISSHTATNVTVLVVAGDSYLYETEVGDYLYITADKPVQVTRQIIPVLPLL